MEKATKTTQIDTVAKHLKKWGAITSMGAFRKYGITRLSAHIWTLRHDAGWNIVSNRVTIKNRNGTKCTYSEYTLIEVGADVG